MWFSGKRALTGRRGQVRSKIENYRATLVRLRDEFLSRTTVDIFEAAVLDAGA
jgi:hypothetical protein